MSTKYRVISAYVAQPNTPESDMMSHVPHIVVYTEQNENNLSPFMEKKEVTVSAECPSSAIDKVNARLRNKWK